MTQPEEYLQVDLVRDAHILLHPIRYALVSLLKKKPRYVSELARTQGEERRLVAYHLDILEERGFVLSRYEIQMEGKAKGKALRMYTLTPKVAKAFDAVKELL